MKAIELIEELKNGAFELSGRTCDTVKAGNPEKEIGKVAVAMFATVDIIKKVKEWGADMLIVHEPTYYDHFEEMLVNPVTEAKKKLIEESGIVLFRYHDFMHHRPIDQIPEGEVHYLGLKGKLENTPYSASYMYHLYEPITALDLAKLMEKELGIKHVKIAGERNKKSTNIALCFGTPGGVYDLLRDENVEIVLTGEICEWMLGEYARDAALLGYNKSLIVMGHIGSERDGMRLLAEKLSKKHTSFETKYFECGEVYTYTEE
ncbi:MAG: Nif3-like dinuclear metal center hexameric protein [Clostridia bacterium]|nr:Nif3-like dinuclear metal center hexameric protein [Clostridia bacterium]